MNLFKAFSLVDERVKAQDDAMLNEAWRVLLTSFSSRYGGIPPAPIGAAAGEAAGRAHHFLKTVAEWDGHGVELLLFRLAQAVEGVPELLGLVQQPYREALAQIWHMIVFEGATVTDIHGMLFQLGVEDALLRALMSVEGAVPAAAGRNGATLDDEYQVDYCDDCGNELDLDGDCLVCIAVGV